MLKKKDCNCVCNSWLLSVFISKTSIFLMCCVFLSFLFSGMES